MYRCELCGAVSRPRESRIVHVVSRPNLNGRGSRIVREIPVCPDHKADLDRGRTIAEIRAELSPVVVDPAPVVPVEPPAPAYSGVSIPLAIPHTVVNRRSRRAQAAK